MQNANITRLWRLPKESFIGHSMASLLATAGSEFLQATPERRKQEAVKMKPKMQWRPQVFMGNRNIDI
jgi:hypothetical protein